VCWRAAGALGANGAARCLSLEISFELFVTASQSLEWTSFTFSHELFYPSSTLLTGNATGQQNSVSTAVSDAFSGI
jgi:hypothetical protein